MSREIDSKVVELQFDNKNFENNVQTSLFTLDKLKKSLNFNGVEQSFSNLEKSAGNVDFGIMSKAVDNVNKSFTALEVVAITALTNITNSAINTGTQLIKSLSVDNISAGWAKFGEKTTSVGTLFSQGFDMSTVTNQLERLNWYTDETSYNFTDMVANIAKFTATGQDLETSVTAMEGIANWAALSGQNANTASRAMYNISQAMGAGSMKLIDYKSIQNASMDTAEFRQKVLDAAVELGTLKKVADDTYATLGGKSFTKSQFTTQLAAGWFDKDVMMKVFNEYSSAVDDIYNYATEHGITASEAIEQMGNSIDSFGLKAFKAAQEARTWSDVLDAVKDAVSTGWMNTFENIFGDYEHAKELWTDLANELYDVFAEGGNQRNDLLKEWNELGGRAKLVETFWNAFHALTDVIDLVKESFANIFPQKTALELVQLTDVLMNLSRQFKMSDETVEALSFALETIFSILSLGVKTLVAVAKGFYPLIQAIKILVHDILYITHPIGEMIQDFDRATKAMHLFDEITYQVSRSVGILASFIAGLVANNVSDFFSAFNANGSILSGVMYALAGNIDRVIKTVIALVSELTGINLNALQVGVSNVIRSLLGSISEAGDKVRAILDKINIGEVLKSIIDTLSSAAIEIKSKVKSIISFLNDDSDDGKGGFAKNILTIVNGIRDAIMSVDVSPLAGLGNKLKTLMKNLFTALDMPSFEKLMEIIRTGSFVGITIGLQNLVDSITGITEKIPLVDAIKSGITDMFDGINEALGGFQNQIKADTLRSVAVSIGILAASLFVLASLDTDAMASGISGLIAVISGMLVTMSTMTKTLGAVNTTNFIVLSVALLQVSSALGVMAGVVVKLSKIDAVGLIKGLGATFGLIAILSKSSTMMTESFLTSGAKLTTISASMAFMAVALNLLIPPMMIFSKMPIENIGKGIFAMVGSISLLSQVVGGLSASMSGIAGLIAMAVALNMLILPMSIFGKMPIENIGKGIFAMAGSMSLLGVVLSSLSATLSNMKAAASLTMLAVAINAIIPPMMIFGKMPIENIGKGIFAMVAPIALLGTVLSGLNATLAGIAGLLIVSAALNLLIPPLTIMGSMPIENIGKGILAMVASIALIGVALNAMSASLAGVAVLLLATTAMNAFIPVVLAFSALDLKQIGTMMLAMGAGLVVLVGGLALLSSLSSFLAPAIPMLWSAAGATLTFAASLSMLAPALLALSIVGGSIVYDIIDAFHIFAENSTQFVEDAKKVLEDVARLIPDAILAICVGVLEGINDFLGPLLDVILVIIIKVLEVIDQYAEPLVDMVVKVLVDILEAIANKTEDLVQAVVDVVIAIIDGLADSLFAPENAQRLRDAVDHLLWNMFDAIKVFLGINSPSTKMEWIGCMMIDGLRNGIIENVDKVMNGIINLFSDIWSFVKENVTNFPQVFKSGMDIIRELMHTGYEEIKDGMKAALTGIGTNFIGGFVEGISEAKDKAVDAVKGFGTDCINKIKDVFGIHSPSEVLSKIGEYFGLGFDNGVDGMRDKARNTVSNFGQSALSGLDGLSTGFFTSGQMNAESYMSGWSSGVSNWAKKSWSTSKEQMMAGADYALNQGYQARQNMIQQEKDEVIEDAANDPATDIFGEQESDAEKELEAQLNQLEIMYNTGAIATEEEYHKRRLALLENYKGEWTKKSSAWLKAERDWFKKQEENANKASSKSKDNVFTEFGKTIDGVYDKAAEKYDRLLEKYKSGEITAAEYEKKYNNLLASSLFARNKLMQHADEEMKKYATEMLQDISDEYEDKLSDIHSKMESFSESMSGDLRDSFKMKTQSDVQTEAYNNASEDLDIQIRVLQKKRDEAAKLYGESNWYTVKLQKDLDEANKKAERLSQRHQNEQDHLGDEKLMALDDQIAKLEDQRDSIIKLYGSNAAKARELEKQIKDLEKQEDEYLLSEEYRENRKNREKNKDKLDSKIVGVEFTDQLKEDAEKLKKYNEELKKLTNRDLAAGFTDILKDMTQEEGLAFAEYLNGLSDDELRTIMSQWEAKKTASRELSETMYAGEVEQATTEFQSKASDILAELPDSGYTAGQKAMKEIGNGFSDAANETLEQCNTTMYDVIDGVFSEANRVRLEDKMRDSWKTALDHTLHEMQWNLDSQSLNIYLHPVIDTTDIGEAMAQSGMKMGIEGSSAYYTQRISAYMNESKVNQVSDIKESIDNNTNATARWMNALDARFDRLERVYEGLEIVIDENSLADGLAVPMSKRMGRYATMQSRGG